MTDEANQSLTQALLKERRSDRKWRNIRFVGWIIILLLYAALIFAPSPSQMSGEGTGKSYVSLVRLSGLIMPNTSFSASHVIPELFSAFSDKNAKGVVLIIDSPGGSPVQASIIHDKILELKKRFDKKVVIVGEDVLASGAYLVASAADKIYVNRDTLTGSIGVVMQGFGFVETLKKLGVTRRLYTSGSNKDRLDPFEPVKEEDVAKLKGVLKEVHQNFIRDVTSGRGDRLRGSRDVIFSGDFWIGESAVNLGLADGVANLWTVLDKEFHVDNFRDYTTKSNLVQSLFRTASSELSFHLLNKNNPIRTQAY